MISRNSIMAHCVAYFPDEECSLAAARGLAAGGADFIEVQLPFSDPMADGPAIQTACQRALERGFTVDKGFRWLRQLSAAVTAPVFLMSYGNLLFRRGVERFCREAAAAGVRGLIVPDLLPPEDEGLSRFCRYYGLAAVPVISPGIQEECLADIAAGKPPYLYTTLRSGITGARTELGASQLRHLKRCRATGAHVLAGFGIESPVQVAALGPHADTLVVGSYFVRQLIEEAAAGGQAGSPALSPARCGQILKDSITYLQGG